MKVAFLEACHLSNAKDTNKDVAQSVELSIYVWNDFQLLPQQTFAQYL